MPAGRNYHMPITGVADAQRPLRKLGSQNGLVVNVIEINPSLLQRLARGPESRFCRRGQEMRRACTTKRALGSS